MSARKTLLPGANPWAGGKEPLNPSSGNLTWSEESFSLRNSMFFLTGCHHKPITTGSDWWVICGASLLNPPLNPLPMECPYWPATKALYGGLTGLLSAVEVAPCRLDLIGSLLNSPFFPTCASGLGASLMASIGGPRMLACGRMRSNIRKIRFPMFLPTEMSRLWISLCTFRAIVKTAFVRLQQRNKTENAALVPWWSWIKLLLPMMARDIQLL